MLSLDHLILPIFLLQLHLRLPEILILLPPNLFIIQELIQKLHLKLLLLSLVLKLLLHSLGH